MKQSVRPLPATLFAVLFAISAGLMVLLGIDANAYYLPALSLLLQALLLWRGVGARCFKRVLEFNQLTAIVLVLDLWLGDLLHLPKLSISAAMLAANLALGGPLMGILAIGVLGHMHFTPTLAGWFQSRQA